MFWIDVTELAGTLAQLSTLLRSPRRTQALQDVLPGASGYSKRSPSRPQDSGALARGVRNIALSNTNTPHHSALSRLPVSSIQNPESSIKYPISNIREVSPLSPKLRSPATSEGLCLLEGGPSGPQPQPQHYTRYFSRVEPR